MRAYELLDFYELPTARQQNTTRHEHNQLQDEPMTGGDVTMSRRKQANPKPVKLKQSDCESEESSASPPPTPPPPTPPMSSTTSFLANLTCRLHVPTEVLALTSRNDVTCVCSVMAIPTASSFGPYLAETSRNNEDDFVLEFESDHGHMARVTISDHGRWLTLCVPRDDSTTNCRAVLDGDAVWCEITRDISPGEKLVAEFTGPSRGNTVVSQDAPEEKEKKSDVMAEPVQHLSPTIKLMFECEFCHVRFSSPSTLHAHVTHYCSMKPSLVKQEVKATRLNDDNNNASRESSSEGGHVSLNDNPLTHNGYKTKPSASHDKRLHKHRHKKIYRCPTCSFTSKKLTSFNRHRRVHARCASREKQSPQAMTNLETYCEVCNIQYSNLHTYQAHKEYYCQKSNSGKVCIEKSPRTSPPRDADSDEAREDITNEDPEPLILQQPQILTSGFPVSLTASNTPCQTILTSPTALYLATSIVTPSGLSGIGLTVPALLMQPTVAQNMTTLNLNHRISARSQESDSPLDLSVPKKKSYVKEVYTKNGQKNDKHLDINNLVKKRNETINHLKADENNSCISSRYVPYFNYYTTKKSDVAARSRPVSKCSACNIVFYKRENYIAHKQHYCPDTKQEKIKDGSSEQTNDSRIPTKRARRFSDEHDIVPAHGFAILKFHCVHCKIPFSCPTTLDAHRNFYCPFRLKTDEQEADKKIKDKLQADKLLKCETCLKAFTSVAALDTHECETHELAVPIKCQHCDYSALTEARLLEHAKVHAPTKVYKCALCGYRGNTMRGMRMHGKIHADFESEFTSDHVVEYEIPAAVPPALIMREAAGSEEEELMRIKNLPYKRRRSRKFIEKSEHYRNQAHSDCRFLCPICYRLCDSAMSLSVHLRNHVEQSDSLSDHDIADGCTDVITSPNPTANSPLSSTLNVGSRSGSESDDRAKLRRDYTAISFVKSEPKSPEVDSMEEVTSRSPVHHKWQIPKKRSYILPNELDNISRRSDRSSDENDVSISGTSGMYNKTGQNMTNGDVTNRPDSNVHGQVKIERNDECPPTIGEDVIVKSEVHCDDEKTKQLSENDAAMKKSIATGEQHEPEIPSVKFCDKCNIEFTYMSTFRAHKKYYCAGSVISLAQVSFA